jgi:tetratricopeptide (TPR) repeat protein
MVSLSTSRLSAALSPFCFAACLVVAPAALAQRRIEPGQAGPPEQMVTLGGWVRADYSQGIPAAVTVRLETAEGMAAGQQPVNSGGYFEFVGLQRANYRLTVSAPGFQVYEQNVDLRSVGDRLNISVQLSPANKSQAVSSPAAPSFTDDNASRKVRKEYEQGDRLLHQGNLSEAQFHLEKAVKEYPCYARAQAALAVVLNKESQLSASESALKKALQCDPDYLDAYTELGQLYYNENQYQQSEEILQQGVRRSPGSWQFHYQLGATDYRLREYRTAEQEYMRAESLSSSVPAEIHVKLADVYLKQNALEKAYSEMQAYLREEPSGAFANELKSVMRRMESDHIVPTAPPSQPPSR